MSRVKAAPEDGSRREGGLSPYEHVGVLRHGWGTGRAKGVPFVINGAHTALPS